MPEFSTEDLEGTLSEYMNNQATTIYRVYPREAEKLSDLRSYIKNFAATFDIRSTECVVRSDNFETAVIMRGFHFSVDHHPKKQLLGNELIQFINHTENLFAPFGIKCGVN